MLNCYLFAHLFLLETLRILTAPNLRGYPVHLWIPQEQEKSRHSMLSDKQVHTLSVMAAEHKDVWHLISTFQGLVPETGPGVMGFHLFKCHVFVVYLPSNKRQWDTWKNMSAHC